LATWSGGIWLSAFSYDLAGQVFLRGAGDHKFSFAEMRRSQLQLSFVRYSNSLNCTPTDSQRSYPGRKTQAASLHACYVALARQCRKQPIGPQLVVTIRNHMPYTLYSFDLSFCGYKLCVVNNLWSQQAVRLNALREMRAGCEFERDLT
jgi:hypothetical protein